MSNISPIEILANGMAAARMRVNTLASNIANAETTRTADGGPYKRRDVVQVAKPIPGSFSSALDRLSMQSGGVSSLCHHRCFSVYAILDEPNARNTR